MSLEIGYNAKTRPDLSSATAAKAAHRPHDLGWTLRLLRATHLGISLFRLKLHGLTGSAADRGFDFLVDGLGEEAHIERLDDGSALLLIIRFEDSEDNVTTRLSARLAALMRESGWPHHAVIELVGVHHQAAEIGHVTDLLAELSYAPRRVIEPGDYANR
ncbi:MAG TPA: hypothetical protein VFO41_02965 [Alphaproteobacteria bacterium]|nr:hypothetical protein [Alphaproteobacteria bacterium]